MLTAVAKYILGVTRLTEAWSSADAGIQIKLSGLGTTALITSNEQMKNIMKIAIL